MNPSFHIGCYSSTQVLVAEILKDIPQEDEKPRRMDLDRWLMRVDKWLIVHKLMVHKIKVNQTFNNWIILRRDRTSCWFTNVNRFKRIQPWTMSICCATQFLLGYTLNMQFAGLTSSCSLVKLQIGGASPVVLSMLCPLWSRTGIPNASWSPFHWKDCPDCCMGSEPRRSRNRALIQQVPLLGLTSPFVGLVVCRSY